MEEGFTCNSCGTVSNTGYFYCEKCHKIHKARREEIKNNEQIIQKGSEVKNESVRL